MIRQLTRSVLGFHDLLGEIDFAALKRSAIRLDSASELNTIRVGIFVVEHDGCARYYCRTRVGWVFPSLFHVRFKGRFELIPHPVRIVFGSLFLCFWGLMNAVGALVIISKWDASSAHVSGLAAIILLLVNAGLLLSSFLFVVIEKKLVLSGYKKYSTMKH
jgi:hypothetical protein